MGSHTIDNTDDAGEKTVNGDGRLYLGKKYAGQTVEYAVRIVGEDIDDE